jgi:hypothetical protein
VQGKSNGTVWSIPTAVESFGSCKWFLQVRTKMNKNLQGTRSGMFTQCCQHRASLPAAKNERSVIWRNVQEKQDLYCFSSCFVQLCMLLLLYCIGTVQNILPNTLNFLWPLCRGPKPRCPPGVDPMEGWCLCFQLVCPVNFYVLDQLKNVLLWFVLWIFVGFINSL